MRGWVVDLDRRPPPGVVLRALAKVTGVGPDAELLALGEWAAWRWAGRRLTFLRAASPDRAVGALPRRRPLAAPLSARPRVETGDVVGAVEGGDAAGPGGVVSGSADGLLHVARRALDAGGSTVVRVPPAADVLPIVEAALRRGQALVLAPGRDEVASIVAHLRRAGQRTARPPEGWALAAAGLSVVGSRAAAWMPVPDLAAVVVLDEHDERFQDERAPTWHARDVAVERARRAGVPCLLVSPVPTPEALAAGRLLAPSCAEERRGWPVVEVVDRTRDDDPLRHGLFSPRLVGVLRSGCRVAVVLNRTGRARLLACQQCSELVVCERCGAALASPDKTRLRCPRCGFERAPGCTKCGAQQLRLLRPGVSRLREELEALVGEPVSEVSGPTSTAGRADRTVPHEGAAGPPAGPLVPLTRVVVGTDALLHRLADAAVDVIAFPDLDAELLAPRFRAAAQVVGRLALAARRLGARSQGGRLLLQTRQPDHPAVSAVLHAEPARFTRSQIDQARRLRLPPFVALARLSGSSAAELAVALSSAGLDVAGPTEGRYLVRAADTAELADALARAGRPGGPVKIEVDPASI